ncbi:RagB/SusD family nutrient uptake outer membrane protein [soil metagenome]
MKLNKISSIAFLLLFMFACSEDHLNLSPLTNISEGNFYNTEAELQQAVDDVYRQLGLLYNGGGLVDLYGELYSDNTEIVFQTTGAVSAFGSEDIDSYTIRSANPQIENAWNNTYNSIFITNNVIYQVENTNLDIDINLTNRWLSEAKVVRALAYFNLIRAFGDVPFVLTPVSSAEAYTYLRESTDVIYQQIITDLEFGKTHLPDNYSGSNIGRITRYAAAAILAKIHLTQGNNSAAQNELELIINSGQYTLDANMDGVIDSEDFNYIFHPDTKNSSASILEAQYREGPNAFNSNHQSRYMPFSHAFNLPGVPESTFRGGGLNMPSYDLADEFENGDPRIDISIVPGYTAAGSDEFVEHPLTFKFFDPNWSNPGSNFTIIRYADILLMYSEVTGDSQYLNQVRERVGLPPFGSDEYPSNLYPTLELAIEHERRVELTHEMHRMFDLVRTNRAIEVLQSKGFNFSEENKLFPIPQNAIDVNPALTQNPGY